MDEAGKTYMQKYTRLMTPARWDKERETMQETLLALLVVPDAGMGPLSSWPSVRSLYYMLGERPRIESDPKPSEREQLPLIEAPGCRSSQNRISASGRTTTRIC